MAQVTLYMDDETLARVREAAQAAGMSMSAWLVQLVRDRTATEWPAEAAALAGAWPDFPTVEELRAGYGEDVPREGL